MQVRTRYAILGLEQGGDTVATTGSVILRLSGTGNEFGVRYFGSSASSPSFAISVVNG